MNIQSRLAKLEVKVAPPPEPLSLGEQVYRRQVECGHPANSFHLYQGGLYPSPEGYPWSQTVKGHCNNCGFDAPLWDVSKIMPEQWERLQHLEYADPSEAGEYAKWLIENDYLDHVLWPPTQEISDHIKIFGGSNDDQESFGEA